MYIRPVDKKYPITLKFGVRYPYSWKFSKINWLRALAGVKHKGVDYGCPKGTPVVAPCKMQQFKVYENHPSYGRCVMAWEMGKIGITHIFAHLDIIAWPREGKIVQPGEVFAWSGNSGKYTSGSHLHWQKEVNGVPVDPLK